MSRRSRPSVPIIQNMILVLARDLIYRLLDLSAERMIALGRLALVTFAVIAVIVEPTEQHNRIIAIYIVSGVYFAFAIASVILAPWRPPTRSEQLLVTVFDIATVWILMHLTGGPSSPFFA